MNVLGPTLNWRKSSHSGGNGGECIEIAALSDRFLIRDSKNPDGPVLHLTPAAARALVGRVRGAVS
ncbi:DUF397 domain-containing protein [Actinomadura adrarensis]|uniref:DUF397 domain-containing protein n=1 Tax=Actinomadura adrarensis TaxID=1819600 RepID=A0ABW3CQK7_9ACTN